MRLTLTMLAALALAGCTPAMVETAAPGEEQELALTDMVPASDGPAAEVPAFTVYFDVSSATLGAETTAILDRLVADPARSRWTQIRLAGHADRSGSARLNRQLSAKRVEAVRQYLVKAGVSAALIKASVIGSRGAQRQPEADDRRVEIFVSGG
ncbi:OmpA family protein [Sphingoaurantiacus capsulatus]|uniref:OmpA family protein n=1 Tax=Sphingoaurantiacus capsulatus TaxID=1771310 RepID=A0ABV7X9G2_9SPHN